MKQDYKASGEFKEFYRMNLKEETGLFKHFKKLNNYLREDFFSPVSFEEVADVFKGVSSLFEKNETDTHYHAFLRESRHSEKFGGEFLEFIGESDPEELYTRVLEGRYKFEGMKLTGASKDMEMEVVGKKAFAYINDIRVSADQIWTRFKSKTTKGEERMEEYTEVMMEEGFNPLEKAPDY